MLLLFRSFNKTPYVYDPRTNELYNVDENVYIELEKAGGEVSRIKDEKIRKGCEEAGITDAVLPMQTPENFKKEIAGMELGFTKLTLGITHVCNLRCKYCIYSGEFKGERTHESKMMSIEMADKIIDEFFVRRKDHPQAVIFYGGEPLLNFPVIKRIVLRLGKMKENVLFSATTNGTCLENDEILDFLVQKKFVINISFDGPVQDVVRVDTQGKGTFRRLMTILEKISKRHPDFYNNSIGFNVTVTPATDLTKTVEFFHTNPLFKGKQLNIIRNYDPDNLFCRKYDFVENEKILSEEFEQLRREYPEIYKENPPFHSGCFLQAMAQINKRPMGDNGSLPLNSCCYPGMNTVYVDIDGTVYACERTEHAPIGHIDRLAVDDKMVEKCVRDYYEIAKKYCPQCWAAKLCPKCFSHVKRGELNEENFVEYCDKFRTSVLRTLELFVTVKEKDEKAFDNIKIVSADINERRNELGKKDGTAQG